MIKRLQEEVILFGGCKPFSLFVDPKAPGRLSYLLVASPFSLFVELTLAHVNKLIKFVGLVFIGSKYVDFGWRNIHAKRYSGIWYGRAGGHGKNLILFLCCFSCWK